MTAISRAVGLEHKSRVSGYKILKGFFQEDTPNLPQVIVVLAEANTANQPGLTTDRVEFTSSQQVADLMGYGSPAHQIARILRPLNSDGVAGIPTILMPQLEDGGAAAATVEITVTGPATSTATHTVVVAGRRSLDFQTYSFSVVSGDDSTTIAASIVDAVNGVLGSPFIASNLLGVVTLTTKWASATGTEAVASIDTGSNTAGVTYAQTGATAGVGVADISDALTQFDQWYTLVINSYGTATLDLLEQFNGVPDSVAPTGRYVGTIFQPFVAFFGSKLDTVAGLTAITDAAARVDQVTNVLCPAPRSDGFTWEAAANVCRVYARIAQDTPHLDINNQSYPDMPTPDNGLIGEMSVYNNRDLLVKDGCSTVTLENAAYKVQDLVTTYHPAGESPLQFAYVRNLVGIDFNIAFSYMALEEIRVKDHVLVESGQTTDAQKAVKPDEWRSVLFDLFDDLAVRALTREPGFSKQSLLVQISGTNPDRFETFFRYKRTGIARIESTDVEAGF